MKDGKIKEEEKRPFLKAGSKAKDSSFFFRDPVLKLCTASGSTPLQQSKFEGFGKLLGNLVSFACAHYGSTAQPRTFAKSCFDLRFDSVHQQQAFKSYCSFEIGDFFDHRYCGRVQVRDRSAVLNDRFWWTECV